MSDHTERAAREAQTWRCQVAKAMRGNRIATVHEALAALPKGHCLANAVGDIEAIAVDTDADLAQLAHRWTRWAAGTTMPGRDRHLVGLLLATVPLIPLTETT